MNFKEKTEQEILDIANPIMDNLMEAATNIDYESHITDFYLPIPEDFTKEKFQSDCEICQSKYGVFTSREYIGLTINTDFVNVYWNQSCSKTANTYLAVLTLSQQNNKYVANRVFVDIWQPKS